MAASSKPVILLVEYYADTRYLVRLLLEMKGCHMIEAENGEEAGRSALEARPDLIFMDLSMPVMDGWKATRRLRLREEMTLTPIIGLSAHCARNWLPGALEAGCTDCFVKPVDEGDIDRILSKFLC